MALFDLKFAHVYFIDGFAATGAVNHSGGYTTTTTTMVVDTITGLIPVGSTFQIGSDPLTYTVTAATGGPNTTGITFSPGLGTAATDNEVITFGGRRVLMKLGDGNVSYEEKRPIEYKKDRGLLDTVRLGDQEPIDVKLDCQWIFLRSISGDLYIPSVEEVIKGVGAASTWVTSSADPCEPYSVNILIVYMPPCPTIDGELILLSDFRYESIQHDAKQGMLNLTGKCNLQQATISRVTNTYPTQ